LGLGFGDRFRGFQGRSGPLEEMVPHAKKAGELQGKRPTKRLLGIDGKEGVDGSSPSEGFEKFLQFSSFCLRIGLRLGVPASTERPRLAADASCEAWNSWR